MKILFYYFKNLGQNDILSDKALSQEFVLLLLLLGGQQVNSVLIELTHFIFNIIVITSSRVLFTPYLKSLVRHYLYKDSTIPLRF